MSKVWFITGAGQGLGIDIAQKALAVEPGFFRTELLVERASTIWPELSIQDYADRPRLAVF